MKLLKLRFLIVLLLALTTATVAWGVGQSGGVRGGGGWHGGGGWTHGGGPWHGGHNHFRGGVVIGVPWGWYYPGYYYPGYYYGAPLAYGSGYYADQGGYQPAEAWWYYCASANGYYPYVRTCPEGWQRVSPQPPPDLR